MASAMGNVVREIREAVMNAAIRSDADLPDLPLRHKAQLASMSRQIRNQDRFDGGPSNADVDAPSHPSGNGSSGSSNNIPNGVEPYKGSNSTKEKGDYGEDVTDAYMYDHGYVRLSHRTDQHGIDGIYGNRQGEVIIVEAKYNTAGLGWTKDHNVRQMTNEWLTGDFTDHEENRIREALDDADLADAVEQLFEGGEVPPVIGRVMPDGSVKLTLPEFDPDGYIANNPVRNF